MKNIALVLFAAAVVAGCSGKSNQSEVHKRPRSGADITRPDNVTFENGVYQIKLKGTIGKQLKAVVGNFRANANFSIGCSLFSDECTVKVRHTDSLGRPVANDGFELRKEFNDAFYKVGHVVFADSDPKNSNFYPVNTKIRDIFNDPIKSKIPEHVYNYVSEDGEEKQLRMDLIFNSMELETTSSTGKRAFEPGNVFDSGVLTQKKQENLFISCITHKYEGKDSPHNCGVMYYSRYDVKK